MVHKIGDRAAIAVAALVDVARPRRTRRRSAATKYRTPTSGALAPPVPEMFESTASAPNGMPAHVVATTSPSNQISGERPAPSPPSGEHLEPPGTLSIAEGSGHPAGQKNRPVTWLIVSLIALSFVIAGVGLIVAYPWLFIAGLAAIVLSCLVGWRFNIMADTTHHGEPGENSPTD